MQPDLVRIAEAAILDCEAFKEATAEGVTYEELQRELRKDADLEFVPLQHASQSGDHTIYSSLLSRSIHVPCKFHSRSGR